VFAPYREPDERPGCSTPRQALHPAPACAVTLSAQKRLEPRAQAPGLKIVCP
jgi:hypothetical protein